LTKLIGNSLILVDTVEYCFKLKEFLSEFCKEWQFEVIYGEIPTEEREIILNGIKAAKSNFCLIGTYGTLSTGISINNLENIYFPDGGKSEIRIRQSLGRGMRLFPTKEYCNVFDLQDMMRYSSFLNHSKERLRIYREQQFPFKISEITI
jgi:superfamily II DNA or RNA helicase